MFVIPPPAVMGRAGDTDKINPGSWILPFVIWTEAHFAASISRPFIIRYPGKLSVKAAKLRLSTTTTLEICGEGSFQSIIMGVAKKTLFMVYYFPNFSFLFLWEKPNGEPRALTLMRWERSRCICCEKEFLCVDPPLSITSPPHHLLLLFLFTLISSSIKCNLRDTAFWYNFWLEFLGKHKTRDVFFQEKFLCRS